MPWGPEAVQPWHLTLDRTGPIYLAIADAIAAAVATGELAPGDRLPPHRSLAASLGVDLTTVTRAYAEARRRGLLESVVGRGTFIGQGVDPRGSAVEPNVVDLSMNLPPQPPDGRLPMLIQQGLTALLSDPSGHGMLGYRTGAGTPRERAAGAAWLRPVMANIDPACVAVAPGAQPALLAVLGLIAGWGDTLLCDRLTYPGLRAAAAQLGVRLLGVAADAHGMLPGALADAARHSSAKGVYVVPTLHNPTKVTLSPDRRAALVAAARETGLQIIEDDAYGMLMSRPQAALAALAPEISYHVATLSKVISPALRVAYVVAPHEAATQKLDVALRSITLMASPLLTGLATRWILDGSAARLRDLVRTECIARQGIARDILPARAMLADPEGIHVWLNLPAGMRRDQFVAKTRRQGVALVPSDAFWVGPGVAPEAVRVSLGVASGQAQLRQALQRVAAALQDAADAPGYVV
jgi:DNA-binding transcriptional MocR family regulator